MSDELVLVTGGTGFLGANLVKLLQQEGYRVRTTVRDAGNKKKVEHLNLLCPEAKHPVEIVAADLLDADSWNRAVEGCTFVHHVASPFPLENPKTEDEVIKPAVDGTLNVLKACSLAKCVKRVVLTSSFIAVSNGKKSSEETYSESDWIDIEDRNNSVYGRSKGLAEKAAWKFVEDLPDSDKFELAVVNPTLILGPVNNGSQGSSIAVLQKMLRREYPMVPRICLPTIDVRDVALAHYRCMTVPEAAGHRHIANGDNLWFPRMTEILDNEFKSQGYNPPTTAMPNFLHTLVSVFNAELRGTKAFKVARKIDNSRMTKVLGITPIPVDKTVLDMAYTVIEKGFVAKTSKYRGPPQPIG